MGSTASVVIFTLLAVGELIADKLTSTPSRLKPPGLIARILLGGLSGACVAVTGMQSILSGAELLGAAGGDCRRFCGLRSSRAPRECSQGSGFGHRPCGRRSGDCRGFRHRVAVHNCGDFSMNVSPITTRRLLSVQARAELRYAKALAGADASNRAYRTQARRQRPASTRVVRRQKQWWRAPAWRHLWRSGARDMAFTLEASVSIWNASGSASATL